MDDFKALIGKVATGATLTRDESATAFDHMMSGEATPSQMGGFLMGLRIRGETVDEITGAVSTMRAKMQTGRSAPGCDRRGRHRRRCVRLLQHLDLRGLHRRRRGHPDRQARQPRALLALGRGRRARRARRAASTCGPTRSRAASTRPASASCSRRRIIRR